MRAGASPAFVLLRVERGAPRPSPEALRAALGEDRRRLGLPPVDPFTELEVTGPFPVRAGDADLDEYAVWER